MNAVNRLFSLLGVSALLLAPAMAAAETGFYAGLGVGGANTEADIDTPIQYYETQFDGSPDFTAPVGDPIQVDFDASDAAFKAFAGYRILDWLAVEGGWYYLGEPDDTTATPDQSTRVETEIELKGWNADVVAFWRFHDQWEAFGKIGVFFWEIDWQSNDPVSSSGSQIGPPNLIAVPSFVEDDESGEDLKGGLGIHYLHDENLALRGEFEYFDVDDTDSVWLLSFSAIWRFN